MESTPINAEGMALLEEFEDFKPYPYPDPASALYRATPREPWGEVAPIVILDRLDPHLEALSGEPWTQGFGFTARVLASSPPMTIDQARHRLRHEVAEFAAGVRAALTRPANENQFAAMVVLAFNIGIAGFARSTVCRAHNRGDYQAAARAFGLWNKAGGRVLRGLTRRRAAESALYLKPVRPEIPLAVMERGRLALPEREPIDLDDVMPQRIDPETSLRRSPIIQGASAAGGLSALGLAAEGASAVGTIRYHLGDWLPYVALAAVIGIAAWLIYQRVKQRREGWA